MTENVASFDSFDSDVQIAAHQIGLVRVVLEGSTDVQLFQRFWFSDRQDVFDFVEACHIASGSGCTGVANGVAISLQDGIPAIGIVDRDTLFRQRDWERLFSLDVAALNPDPDGDIYITSRWEVEAYLLEVSSLAAWVAAAHKQPPAPQHLCDQALSKVLTACETLLSAAHFFAAQHAAGTSVVAGMFCNLQLAKIQELCSAAIAGSTPEVQEVAEKVTDLVQVIVDAKPASDEDRLSFFLRYVDTKRLLKRLVHALSIKDDSLWTLAALMMITRQRPSELEGLLSRVETRYAVG